MNIETNEQYHSNDAISHSKLELFRRRPISYYRRFVGKTLARPEATEAFRIGSAAHCAVLEPDTFYARYAMRPEGIDRRTKDGKAAFAQFEAENAGKVVIGSDELGDVREMAAAVAHHPLASQLLAAGKPELTWRVEPKGSLALQCRTDWFNPTGCELSGWRPYVADLKTVESLDSDAFRNFERACFSFGYHRQAGFYLPLITEILGGPVFDFFFVASRRSSRSALRSIDSATRQSPADRTRRSPTSCGCNRASRATCGPTWTRLCARSGYRNGTEEVPNETDSRLADVATGRDRARGQLPADPHLPKGRRR